MRHYRAGRLGGRYSPVVGVIDIQPADPYNDVQKLAEQYAAADGTKSMEMGAPKSRTLVLDSQSISLKSS
jgi:hypothetical protein